MSIVEPGELKPLVAPDARLPRQPRQSKDLRLSFSEDSKRQTRRQSRPSSDLRVPRPPRASKDLMLPCLARASREMQLPVRSSRHASRDFWDSSEMCSMQSSRRSSRRSSREYSEIPSYARWKILMSKVLARVSGVTWEAIASGVFAVGFIPVSEEMIEKAMTQQARQRRKSIDI
eukprot:3916487-Prymnesium_polylepis.1